MADKVRLVAALRAHLDPYRDGFFDDIPDEKILEASSGSRFRVLIELRLEWQDFKAKVFESLPVWLRRHLTNTEP
jgi:hypothetical protein